MSEQSCRKFDPVQTSSLAFSVKIKSRLWDIVNASFYRFSPFFMRGWRRFLLRAFGAEISHTASPDRCTKFSCPWNVVMKDFSSTGAGAWIYALDKITIGEKSCIGNDVYLLTGSHNIFSEHFDLLCKPIFIGDNCWISTRAMILPGIQVGEGAVIAASAVVTKDVEPWSVVGGNPAKFIKKRELK